MTALTGLATRPVGPFDPPRAVTARKAGDGLVATVLVTSVSVALVGLVPALRHWFMVPTTLAGILIGTDAVRWFRRGADVFDPRACAGLLGLQFLYVAPILNVALDEWSARIYDPPVWREALGALGILNTVGLALYRLVLAIPFRTRRKPGPARPLRLPTFYLAGLCALALSLLAFGYEIAMFGGLGGFVAAMSDRVHRVDMSGMGPLVILAEAFPTIAVALVLVRWRAALARRPALLVLLVAALAVTQFAIAGLKGSRSSTLWPLLLCLVLVHLVVRRISRKTVVAVAVVVFAFLYVYAFYKIGGVKAIDDVRQTRTVAAAEAATGRDLPMLLTGDLGRADIQAVILHRYLDGQFEPVYGATYLRPWYMFVPDSLFSHIPASKVDIGSRILYNPLVPDGQGKSSKIYGMTGEGIINFGLVGGVLAFVVFGFVIRAVWGYYLRAGESSDLAPKLIAPMLWALVNAHGADLDNIVFFMCKYALPLILLVLVARRLGHHHDRALAPHRVPALRR